MKISLNHKEFLDYKYKHESLLSIRAKQLLRKNKNKIRTTIIFGTNLVNMIGQVVPAVADDDNIDLSGIDRVGNIMLMVIRKGGYWVLLCVAIAHIFKVATRENSDHAEILKIIVTYLLIYASTYLVPLGFNIISEAFA